MSILRPKIVAIHKEPIARAAAQPIALSTEQRAPTPTMTDEGVLYRALATDLIVNLSEDKRFILHVQMKPFLHVAENTSGKWIYRHDI